MTSISRWNGESYYQGAEAETDINVIEEVSFAPGGRT